MYRQTYSYLILVLALLMYVGYSLSILHNGHNWGGDFALYISQAQAMLQGTTEQLKQASNLSCEWSYYRMNPDLYPPTFPLMLTPVLAAVGLNFWALKLVSILAYCGVLIAVYCTFKPVVSAQNLSVILGLLASSAVMILFNNNILADVPLMAFSWILIGVDTRMSEAYGYKKNVILALCMVLVYTTKALSISLIAAWFVKELVQLGDSVSERKTLLFKITLTAVLWGVGVMLIQWVYPYSNSGYASQAQTLSLQTILDNLAYYKQIPDWFLYHSNAFVWISLPFVFTGLIIPTPNALFYKLGILFHLILLIIWPFQEGLRFLFHLIPFYFYFGVVGASYLAQLVAHRFNVYKVKYFPLVFWSYLIGYGVYQVQKVVNDPPSSANEIGTPEAIGLFQFVKQHTTPQQRFIFFKPNVLRLLAQRESYYLLEATSIQSSGATWWIYKHGDTPSDTAGLHCVYTNAAFSVFKLR